MGGGGSGVCLCSHFSCVQLCVILWTVACHVPLSMGFSRQEYWSGLSSPGDLPNPGIEPTSLTSPALAGGFFTSSFTWLSRCLRWWWIHLHCRQILFRLSHRFTDGSSGKESASQYRRCKRHGFNPWVGKIPRRRSWQSITVFLPRESHGLRSLVGYGL